MHKLHNEKQWGGELFDYQVIVVNDGSTDNTLRLLFELSSRYPKLLVLDQANSGPGGARENALNHAECDYLAFCDADDWVEPDWLLSMYKCLKDNDADFVKFNCYSETAGGQPIYTPKNTNKIISFDRDSAVETFVDHNQLNGIMCTNLFKRSLFDGVHYNKELMMFEDEDIMSRIILRCNKVIVCKNAKYHYVVDGNSLSNGKTNVNRLKSTIIFFNSLAETIGKSYPNLLTKIHQGRNFVFMTSLVKMYQHSIYDKFIESELLLNTRNNWSELMKRSTFKYKLILMLLYGSPALARQILKRL